MKIKGTLILLLLLFWAVSLRGLATIPPVYQDEPWQASTGWKLATEGVFGSDMFAGHYNMDRRYYGYMPLHPVLLAAVFRIAGLGLFQARLETVILGLLTLCLTYGLGRRLFGPPFGFLAVAILIGLPLFTTSRYQVTGIPLLDFARVARYDMVVPVFGLSALHAYLTATRHQHIIWYGLSGLLAGLAGLGHLHGLFFVPVLVMLIGWNRNGWRALGALLAGFTLAWLPYVAYVMSDLASWRGQTREYGPRFDLLDPAWYWSNLRRESLRYPLGLTANGWAWRPGLWATAVLLPAAWAGLARSGTGKGDRNAHVLLVPALALPFLFALLITLKLPNYVVAFLPFWALCLAWFGLSLWRWARQEDRRLRWIRVGLAMLVAAVILEGALQVSARERLLERTTPYDPFIAQVRQQIPDDVTVLGLHSLWLGLHDLDYRNWFVPVAWTDPAYHSPPLTPQQAMEAIDPDAILLDPAIREYLNGPPYHAQAADPRSFLRWMQEQGFERTGQVTDPTYGLIEIYRREAP